MKPPWLKKKLSLTALQPMQKKLRALNLHTVCEEARCPNISECFARGIATIMIMGEVCTRACKFCAVATGRPKSLDPADPRRVAHWASSLGLKHLVITSVDRDDLPDLGAGHFAETVRQIRRENPGMIVEVLTPDFQGKGELISQVAGTGPEIYNHNLETVQRLTPRVRSASKYARSLSVISHVKKNFPRQFTKSGLMLGLGEEEEEVIGAMRDLVESGCDLLTLGQYLQPTPKHLPVVEYIHPDRFNTFKQIGEEIGFRAVFSGPFVRSSYMAENFLKAARESKGSSTTPPPYNLLK
ncbi:MAG: lipoyl synthase [Deltaproteobacteria bacterium]|nr:lipoyl synthase [Deltaproteobacteria bacterium]